MEGKQNEFGEEISDGELTDWANRVRKISDKKIDTLWYLCDYIYSEREDKSRAISQKYIDRIRESLDSARNVVGSLWDECRTEDIKKNLSIVENS